MLYVLYSSTYKVVYTVNEVLIVFLQLPVSIWKIIHVHRNKGEVGI